MISAAAKHRLVDPVDAFRLRAEARAYLFWIGDIDLHTAVDELQLAAEGDGLVELLGQDEVQLIMARAFAPYGENAR